MRTRWIVTAIAVVVVAALGFGAWYVFGGSDPAKPKLDTSAPVDSGGRATPDGSWKVQRGADVYAAYRMTEVFAGDVVHKTAVGKTPTVDGTLTIGGGQASSVAVTADLRDLTSDRSTRDNYIRRNGLESDTFPTATFKLSSPITLTSQQKGTELDFTATGDFTLHGVTKQISVPLKARWTGSTISIVASGIPVKLADYNITPPDTGVVKVDDHGSFEFALTFVPA